MEWHLCDLDEVFDADGPEIKAGKLATLELFAEALAIYSEGKFAEAARLFSQCWRHHQGDRAAKIYLLGTLSVCIGDSHQNQKPATQFRLIATVPNSIATWLHRESLMALRVGLFWELAAA